MPPILPEGVYEQVVTKKLEPDLAATKQSGLEVLTGPLAESEADLLVARHVAAELRRSLGSLPKEDRDAKRIELCNTLVALLEEGAAHTIDAVSDTSQLLLAVHRGPTAPARSVTPLATSGLLTGADGEPRFGAELEAEIATADRIDLLVSFITWEGWRRLREGFEQFAAAGRRLRILTTTYTGATEAEAVEALSRLPGAEVRISYDTRRTRLHAKAWLFHRRSGFSTAWIGSANLSRAALGGGLEWTVKVGQADLPHVLEKFQGTFDTLWESNEFERFDPTRPEDCSQLRKALEQEGHRGGPGGPEPMLFVSLQPFPFQQAILDQLEAERALHGRWRNLVVAATGTGKTLLAAFDYRRIAAQSAIRPRLLFVAHREELLAQARLAYRHVLHDEAFGELLGGGREPVSFDHLFTTVQSFRSRHLAEKYPPDHWAIVVVDECHHSTAETYTDLVERLTPKYLLGLTATPERADGEEILRYFDGRAAAEIRLWGALEQQLLSPFEYYGLADGIDLSTVRWERGAYVPGDLDRLYTGHDRRAELIIEQFRRLRGRVREARAIGFCAGVAHAEFMARKFEQAGIPALAVHGGTADEARRAAPGQLARREKNILFTCDLFNEGIDLPFVDTLLLLRPTASPTVFLQQLGRGLRLFEGKQSCLVLDFIGQSHEKFRFDRTLTAMTGVPRGRLSEAVKAGFPTLPSGCHLKLDRVARETILENLRAVLGGGPVKLTVELRECARRRGTVTLAQFLDDTGRPLEDVYSAGGWTNLRRLAGTLAGEAPKGEQELGRKLELLLHIDDPERLSLYARLANGTTNVASLSAADRRRLLMLGYQLYRESNRLLSPEQVPALITNFPALQEEFAQLVGVLFDRVRLASTSQISADWPLALHRAYSRREAQTAVGDWTEARKPDSREGVRRIDDRTELLFVTLTKEEKHFSQTTRYRDYAISPHLFHWQSQSNTSAESPAGRRYIQQAELGQQFLLFVRKEKREEFRFLGTVHYVRHEGSRPVSIVWRLEHPMPAGLYQAYATLHAA